MSKNIVWIALVVGIGLGTTACGNISRTPTAPTPAYSSGFQPGQGPLDAPQGVQGGNGNGNNGNNDGDHNDDGHGDNGQGNGGNNGNNGDNGDNGNGGDNGDGGDTDPPNGPLQIAGLYDGVVTLGAGNVGCHSPITFVVELTQNGASVNASVLYGTTLLVWHGTVQHVVGIVQGGDILNLAFSPGVNIPFRCNFTNYLASGASFTGTIVGGTITGAGFVSLSDTHQEVGIINATAILTKQ